MEYSDILQNEPYSLGKKEKQRLFNGQAGRTSY